MATIEPTFKLKETKPVDQPTVIFLIAYLNYKRFKYSIGKKIEPMYWDTATNRPAIIKGDKELQKRLSDINVEINKHYNAFINIYAYWERQGIVPSIATLKKDMKEKLTDYQEEPKEVISLNKFIEQFNTAIENGTRLTEKGMRYSHGTVKNYKGFKVQFDEFQKEMHRKFNYEDITIDFYDQYVQFFNKKDYSLNTIGRHIKNLKTIMKTSKEEGLHSNTEPERKKFKILKTDSDQIYLNEDELTSMYNLDLSNDKDKEKEIARDVFLIGCYTALRFSDYSRIKKDNIRTTAQGNKVITMITKKTGEQVIIPLEWHWRLDELLKKYDYTVPKIWEQKLNQKIKLVGKDAKITEPIEIEQLKGGLKVKSTAPKYQLIKTHTARRSGATNMYKYGIPAIDIMKITGHKKESNFMLYIKQSKEETADRIITLFKIHKPILKTNIM